ncbi:hypothetical protein EOD39_17013 [Acipenser ruthenus]|uniref:Uncharacterized protein n=1 Tax=Acipenser ruthenus TaxID=7906 RepID=A0A444V4H4_ACIRT|nr:hypothetical protein EOD39_17013 [Acipenser ruthenus]
MDVSVSVSFFQDELASTIEHAVKAAVDTVLCQITKVVGGKFTEFRMEMAGKEKENESLKLRLEISESELKAVRECMNAADADIKQPLRNMNPDCNEQDFQRNENQGLFIRVQGRRQAQVIIPSPPGVTRDGHPSNTTIVGTLRQNKTEIPADTKPKREEKSRVIGIAGNLPMALYVPKKGKSVVVLSMQHHHAKVADKNHNQRYLAVSLG